MVLLQLKVSTMGLPVLLLQLTEPEPDANELIASVGVTGVVALEGVAGYYPFLSMMMNTARTPVPADSTVPPLVALEPG